MIYFVENQYCAMWDRVESGIDVVMLSSFPDWENLAKCSAAKRLAVLQYPQHDIQILEDGTVPNILRVPIPFETACGEAVSRDAGSFSVD